MNKLRHLWFWFGSGLSYEIQSCGEFFLDCKFSGPSACAINPETHFGRRYINGMKRTSPPFWGRRGWSLRFRGQFPIKHLYFLESELLEYGAMVGKLKGIIPRIKRRLHGVHDLSCSRHLVHGSKRLHSSEEAWSVMEVEGRYQLPFLPPQDSKLLPAVVKRLSEFH